MGPKMDKNGLKIGFYGGILFAENMLLEEIVLNEAACEEAPQLILACNTRIFVQRENHEDQNLAKV